jgi:hypothetical protein
MRAWTSRAWLAVVVAGASVSRPAHAAEITPYVDRGLMLGGGQLYMVLSLGANVLGPASSLVDATVTVGLGITPRINLDSTLGTISFGGIGVHSPQVGVWAGLVDTTPFELDATTHATFVTGDPRQPAILEPGLQSILRIAHVARVDLGVYVPITVCGPAPTGLRVPLAGGFQLGSPRWNLTLSSGVSMTDARDLSTLSVPLGISVAYSQKLDGGGAFAISPSLTWPAMIGAPAAKVIGLTVALVSP